MLTVSTADESGLMVRWSMLRLFNQVSFERTCLNVCIMLRQAPVITFESEGCSPMVRTAHLLGCLSMDLMISW